MADSLLGDLCLANDDFCVLFYSIAHLRPTSDPDLQVLPRPIVCNSQAALISKFASIALSQIAVPLAEIQHTIPQWTCSKLFKINSGSSVEPGALCSVAVCPLATCCSHARATTI